VTSFLHRHTTDEYPTCTRCTGLNEYELQYETKEIEISNLLPIQIGIEGYKVRIPLHMKLHGGIDVHHHPLGSWGVSAVVYGSDSHFTTPTIEYQNVNNKVEMKQFIYDGMFRTPNRILSISVVPDSYFAPNQVVINKTQYNVVLVVYCKE